MIKESEYNFHYGKNHDMRPYLSDSKYQMAGRETGHFGSGTYFSTYKGDRDLDKYRDGSNNFNPSFIQIANNVYRVDFDLYKNLYRVRSKRHGDILFTMLRDLNRMFNRISYMGSFNRYHAIYENADLYQRIKANADGLGLRCPSYYELTRMAQSLGKDDNDIRSFSTVFMEWNGFNGVNVSGIDYYDNTRHGSVIYDLSKVGGEMKEVTPKSLYTGYKDYPYDDMIVRSGIDDNVVDSLRGDSLFWADKLNKMSSSYAMRLLKNYIDSGNILNGYELMQLNETLIKRYLRILYVRNPRNVWGDRLCDDIVYGNESRMYTKLIEKLGLYYWVNYKSDKGSVLVNLLNNFDTNLDWGLSVEQENRKKKEYLSLLMRYMQRELNKYEREFIEDDYYLTVGE